MPEKFFLFQFLLLILTISKKKRLTRMVSQLNYGEKRRTTGYELFVSFVPFCRTH